MVNHKKVLVVSLFFYIVCSFFKTQELSNFSICSTATATTTADSRLIPCGNCIGVMLATDGVLVVKLSDIVDSTGNHISPAKIAGIKSGDLIQSFNGKKIATVSELITAISNSQGKPSSATICNDNTIREVTITPVFSHTDKSFKIGALVKDAASGIGTMTFYNPDTKEFAALGHGICDAETGKLLPSTSGSILPATIVSVDKGEKGIPGELNGIFNHNDTPLGEITQNNSAGLFGCSKQSVIESSETLPVASRKDVKIGNAQIYANVEGRKVEKFNIEIIKILPKAISHQKGFIIRITDEELIKKTGGIVQGMSGSPILQNGKIVGAVTHVFVNDPTRGYGIFIENMLTKTTIP